MKLWVPKELIPQINYQLEVFINIKLSILTLISVNILRTEANWLLLGKMRILNHLSAWRLLFVGCMSASVEDSSLENLGGTVHTISQILI